MKNSTTRIEKKKLKKIKNTETISVDSLELMLRKVVEEKISATPENNNSSQEVVNEELRSLKEQLEETTEKLREARLKYRDVTKTNAELKTLVDSTGCNNLEDNEKLDALKKNFDDTSAKFNVANTKVKSIELINNECKRDNLKIRIEVSDKNMEIEKLHRELSIERDKLMKVKDHLSYKLGNALVQSLKSWKGFYQLPGRLVSIGSIALERKKSLKTHGQTVVSELPLIRSEDHDSELKIYREKLLQLPKVTKATKLKKLKVATVMDQFTFSSYDPEATLFQLTPENWLIEISEFEPDFLFIESAWRGKNDLWGSKVGHTSQELVGIVDWCNKNKIPTLFWNKEDPIHFETFLNTAKLFDHIFTTDIDCVSRYKKSLGHNNVFFLPFAAQPTVNNPVEKYQRKDKLCFAGAYYVKYPERTKDLNNFVINLPEFKDIEIYDRNFGKDDPNYMFPKEFDPYIVGTLAYEEIDKAYKGYNYAINLNSIKQSQSMFARRAYELLASNTITVSNFSHGLRLLFGDLVFTSDSGSEIVRRLEEFTGSELQLKQFRLEALRKVMSEHTYQDRINYIYSKLSNSEKLTLLPNIKIISYVKSQEELDAILESFEAQTYMYKTISVILSGFTLQDNVIENQRISVLTAEEASKSCLLELVEEEDCWLGVMVVEDFYGENYLTDLALATRYTNHSIIGKKAFYRWDNGLHVSYPNAEYNETSGLTLRHAIVDSTLLEKQTLREFISTLYTWKHNSSQFGIDSFNYCMDGRGECESLAEFNNIACINKGASLLDLQTQAEAMKPSEEDISSLKAISPEQMLSLIKPIKGSQCVAQLRNDKLQVSSQIPDGKHEYWYSNSDFKLKDINANGSKAVMHLETTPGLNLQVVLLFLDANKERLSHTIFPANKNSEITIPEGTHYIRPGLRVYASGIAEISNLYLEAKPVQVPEKVACSDYLLLTNNYASYDDLYKNGFVHSRVKAYKEHGLKCDVFRFKPDLNVSYHEFEDIDVVTGGREVLESQLSNHKYKTIMVHFLDAKMWEVLKHHIHDTKVIVWCHGSDIQSYRRREFLYETEIETQRAKEIGEKRDSFWQTLLEDMPRNLHMVFVSQYLATCVEEDLNLKLPKDKYSIISNPINTDKFNYIAKPVEQRKKVLSIRPYASKVYANDLSVKAILELSKEQFFNELEFRLVGDGPLFDSTLEPLSQFDNVIIEKRFLNHNEIAELHKEYGVFLCPSRMDTQGVSRDEAMSSGLVPVTNAVAAIPEFVDDKIGYLSNENCYLGLVSALKSLYENKEEFISMSKLSSQRVLNKTSNKVITTEEITLIETMSVEAVDKD
ncbi:DUF3880 domain-containing protein [Vibrio kyushuensis]|uniref:glycosyltransferase family protein n=1 Tax=Vibrio kyushuensis TaxID=2910249 RepID=UPI003D0FBFC9